MPGRGATPRTGDAIQVPGKKVPFFKAGKALREKMGSLGDSPVS